jgi:hypothetical protein
MLKQGLIGAAAIARTGVGLISEVRAVEPEPIQNGKEVNEAPAVPGASS